MLLAHLGTFLSTHAEGICWKILGTPQMDFPWAPGPDKGEKAGGLNPIPLSPTFLSAPSSEGEFYRNWVPGGIGASRFCRTDVPPLQSS